jgi:hypothetical protein
MSLRLHAAILSILILFCTSTKIFAQNSDGAVGTAVARIIEPMTVSGDGTNELKFGNLKTSAHSGTIEVDAETNDYGAITGGITTNNPNQDRHAASFNVTGEPGFQFTVTITGSSTTSPGVVSDLEVYPAEHALDNSGNASFRVGGKLSLQGNLHNFKIYTSDIAVTVNYD